MYACRYVYVTSQQEASLDLSQKTADLFFRPVRSKVPYPNAFTSNFHKMSISEHTIMKADMVKNRKLYQRPYKPFHDFISQTHMHVHV
jgi:hypothetical protein